MPSNAGNTQSFGRVADRPRRPLVGRFSALVAAVLVAAQAGALELPLVSGQGGGYYLMGSAAVNAPGYLLDTGASYVSLTRASFARLQAATEATFARNITGIMANGERATVPIYRLAELALAEDCVLQDIEVAVLAGSDRDILGMNALKRLQPFTIALEPAVLSSESCQ